MPGHVVITGASRGIGRALALEFAARGNPLVLCARSENELTALADDIEKRFGRKSLVVAADLTKPEGCARVEDATRELTLEGLVNNAGFGTAGKFVDCDRESERTMIRLNVEALTDLCHRFVPRLRGRPGAFVVNVASTAAFQPVPLFSTYSATKAFVLSLSEALAEELAPEGIHVLALCPGVTQTGFQAEANVAPPGGATPEEVARYAVAALQSKKRVAVHGAKNSFLAFGTRFTPRALVVKMARKTMEPWFANRS